MYTAQSLFYYPYGSFSDQQSPILRAAALYFDRLFILDPEKASAGTVGAEPILNDLALLKKEGILSPVAPETVLGELSGEISKAIQDDLKDESFLQLCRSAGQTGRWMIALSKLPDDRKLDEAVRRFLVDQAEKAGSREEWYSTTPEGGRGVWGESGDRTSVNVPNVPVYNEVALTAAGHQAYRYAEFPLELGESIMINHALFASLVLKRATPITDNVFHDKVQNTRLSARCMTRKSCKWSKIELGPHFWRKRNWLRRL
jgi:hypothetical protein